MLGKNFQGINENTHTYKCYTHNVRMSILKSFKVIITMEVFIICYINTNLQEKDLKT